MFGLIIELVNQGRFGGKKLGLVDLESGPIDLICAMHGSHALHHLVPPSYLLTHDWAVESAKC